MRGVLHWCGEIRHVVLIFKAEVIMRGRSVSAFSLVTLKVPGLTLLALALFFVFSVSTVKAGTSSDGSTSGKKNVSTNVYLLPVPSVCVYVAKVEKGKVYLEDLPGSAGNPSCMRASVIQVSVIPDERGKIEIYHNGSLWKEVTVSSENLESLTDYVTSLALESFYKDLEKIVPGEKLTPEEKAKVAESLKKTEEYVNSREFQEKVESEKKRIADLLGIYRSEDERKKVSYYEDYGLTETRKGDSILGLSPDERIYVFVSQSVPVETVRRYVRDAVRVDPERVIFVLRGGIGGLTYVRPTVEWIYRATVKNPDCDPLKEECRVYPIKFQIDPFLFRRYGINEVPAVVYARGVERYLDFSEGLPETKVSDYYVSYGDVSLFYHLYVLGSASGNERMKAFAERYLNYQVSESQ